MFVPTECMRDQLASLSPESLQEIALAMTYAIKHTTYEILNSPDPMTKDGWIHWNQQFRQWQSMILYEVDSRRGAEIPRSSYLPIYDPRRHYQH